MSHSSTLSTQASNPMKKKVIAAIVAVLIGHVGVLWTLNQLKTPELKKIDKKPLTVKFVKIKQPEKPKQEPAKPKEPPKPKKVKIVEKPAPLPPKKVEKITKVKKSKTQKAVDKPVNTQSAPVISTTVTTKQTPIVTTTTQTPAPPKPEPTPPPGPPKPEPAPPPGPKTVTIGGGGIQWSRSPKFAFNKSEIANGGCKVMVSIKANEKGDVTSATSRNSTCSADLTEKIISAVRKARFKPYKENGVAYPISAVQPFDLN